jgi:uncharacterized protein DUF4175
MRVTTEWRRRRVSPDERVVQETFARAMRRARIVAIAEGLAWGAVVAVVSLVAGALVATATMAWRLRRTRRRHVVSAVDRGTAGARNIFVSADELSSGRLLARPDIRERVFADAARLAQQVEYRRVFPKTPAVRAAAMAGAAWAIVAASVIWRIPVPEVARRLVTSTSPGTAADTVHLTVTIEPPPYTLLPSRSFSDPAEIAAVEGSTMMVVVGAGGEQSDGSCGAELPPSLDLGRTGQPCVTADHDGAQRPLSRGADGRFSDRVHLARTGYYTVTTATGARRVVPIVVSPDALPTVRVSAPGRDLVYPAANQQVAFVATATDDFGLQSLSLQYTRMAGSGETYQFEEGTIPLTLAKSTNREWRGTATRSLAALGLKEGDVLVYRAVASDARAGSGAATSDAFFIEISTLAAAAGDAFTVPQEETRYALSEQMLVIKTDRLDQRRGSMPREEFDEAAINLSIEQRMIRAEFVFMLGGEIEDEDVEAAQSTELAEGRLQNRGQRDLRAATVAMSEAEKLLTGGSMREALAAERRAIAALQRAFARDRYILRALAGQTDLDPNRRLTGTLPRANTWRRDPRSAGVNRRAALLQDLMAGLGDLRARVRESAPAHEESARSAVVLAGEALRVDPESAPLRRAAADLQRIGDSWRATAADARRQAIDGVASAVARELMQALAPVPPGPSFADPALSGAFADAKARGAR